MRLHRVQVSCPRSGEDAAHRFWVEGLGMDEVEKPATLAGRGGCWFRASGAEIHVGGRGAVRAVPQGAPGNRVELLSDDRGSGGEPH